MPPPSFLGPIALLTFLLPGLALELNTALRWHAPGQNPWVRLIDLFGFGFAVVAALGMLSFYLPVRVTGSVLGLLIALAAGLAGWGWVRRERPGTERVDAAQPAPAGLPVLLTGLGFLAILIFRFVQSAELALPAWVDPVHHTLLVRLILEGGGWPAGFEPFMPVPLFYHAGYHTNAALFAALTGFPPERAVLVFGQILNALVALAVFRLGRALWEDDRRALVAMLLVGFGFLMPGYYLSWGRYTLLSGVLLLALAMSAALELVRRPGQPGRAVRLAVLTAGLLLTHYFAGVLFALFLVVFGLERLAADRRFLRSGGFKRLAGAVVAGGLFALPWLVRVASLSTAQVRVEVLSPAVSPDVAFFDGYLDYLLLLLGPERGHMLYIVALAGLGLLGWRKEVRPLALFALAAGVLSLPWGVRLAPFRPDHGVIVAFLPASLLAADVLVRPLEVDWPVRVRPVMRALLAVAVAGIVVWGIREMRSIVNPATVLADADDVRALAWIEENTPEDAVFLVNTAYWQDGAYRGVDGGWWIAPLAGRRTSLPPALYLDGEAGYVAAVLDQAQRMAEVDGCGEALWALIEETGATHVYLHQGRGELQPASLVGCTGLAPVYGEGEVFVFLAEEDP